MTLHERIAAALGWSLEDALSFSLPALRDIVRITHPKLAAEISAVLTAGTHVTRRTA